MSNEKPLIDYEPKSMSFAEGFLGPKNPKDYQMIYSHTKALAIVNSKLDEGLKVIKATCGLDGDFNVNNDVIYDGENFSDYSAYNISSWATPILIIEYSDKPSETYQVWDKK